MLPFAKSLVRGFRRLTAHLAPPGDCPICLDQLPVISVLDEASDTTDTHVRLLCRHKFCTDCLRPYVEMKIKAREVEDDQLICPVVECKRGLQERDLELVGGDQLVQLHRKTLKRVRDEKNPSARWCPRAGCGELILCESTGSFTCPKCSAVGCFKCRGFAHRINWLCRAKVSEDASFSKWLKSVGDRRSVRGCPRCSMSIWKTEGCNHMTCTSCRHEYCWVCDSDWDRSHYACYEVGLWFLGSPVLTQLAQRVVGYLSIAAIATCVSVYGVSVFIGWYCILWMVSIVVERLGRQVQRWQGRHINIT